MIVIKKRNWHSTASFVLVSSSLWTGTRLDGIKDTGEERAVTIGDLNENPRDDAKDEQDPHHDQ